MRLPAQAARQLPDQSTTLRVDSSSTMIRAFGRTANKRLMPRYSPTRSSSRTLFCCSVAPDGFLISRRVQFAGLATRHGVPTAYGAREHVEAGGLMSYGTDNVDAHRQVGVYTGQILKGAKPADLPVLQSTKFEFVITSFDLSGPRGALQPYVSSYQLRTSRHMSASTERLIQWSLYIAAAVGGHDACDRCAKSHTS